MIAMALSCEPSLLIADEPTTALDVTIQAQILELLRRLRTELGMAVLLITHDLGVVAGFADRLAVMYAGRLVELGPTETILADPAHPYTVGLLRSLPRLDRPRQEALSPIEGSPPDLASNLEGCPFAPRCGWRIDTCWVERPAARPGRRRTPGRCPDLAAPGGLPQPADPARDRRRGSAARRVRTGSATRLHRRGPRGRRDHRRGRPVTSPAAPTDTTRPPDGAVSPGAGPCPGRRPVRTSRSSGSRTSRSTSRSPTGCLRRRIGLGQGRRRRLVRHRARRDTRPRRRVGLRQDDGRRGPSSASSEPIEGAIELGGEDLLGLKGEDLRKRRRQFQMVFQDPYSSLDPRQTVGEILAEPLRVHDLAKGDARPQADRRAARPGRPRPGLRRALSARVQRRPASAHRHRPGARRGAGADRLRRAHQRARRLDPGAGHQPARAPPGATSA